MNPKIVHVTVNHFLYVGVLAVAFTLRASGARPMNMPLGFMSTKKSCCLDWSRNTGPADTLDVRFKKMVPDDAFISGPENVFDSNPRTQS